MIRNIVFDMGNVVLSYDPNYIIEHFTKEKDQQRLLVEAIFRSLHHYEGSCGAAITAIG